MVTYHLLKEGNLWVLKEEGSDFKIFAFSESQFERALENAERFLKSIGGKLIIHNGEQTEEKIFYHR